MDERLKLPHYDPDYCLKVAKCAASVCISILFTEVVMLLLVAPSAKCPGWTMYAETGQATYLWILAAVVSGGTTIGICYVVLRWKEKFSQDLYDGIAYRDDRPAFPYVGFGNRAKYDPGKIEPSKQRELNFEGILFSNTNSMFLRVCTAWCLFGALPLFLMITKCTTVPKYLGY
jgi:hypothetical protein